jgi:hypothetical protein
MRGCRDTGESVDGTYEYELGRQWSILRVDKGGSSIDLDQM